MPQRFKGKGRKGQSRFNSNTEKEPTEAGSNKLKPTDTKKLRFERKGMHQRVTYDAIVKKLIIDANRFKGFGDAALMLMSNHEIDLELHRPDVPIIPEKTEDREVRQKAADKEYEDDLKEWKKRKHLYENVHKRNICSMISERCDQDLLDQLEKMEDFENFSFNDPLRFLEAIRYECVTFEEDEWPIASIVNIMLEALTLSQTRCLVQRLFLLYLCLQW
jgi:hypothetical protein